MNESEKHVTAVFKEIWELTETKNSHIISDQLKILDESKNLEVCMFKN